MTDHSSSVKAAPPRNTASKQLTITDRDEYLRVAAVTWISAFGVAMVVLFSFFQGLAGHWDLVVRNQISLLAFGSMLAFNRAGRLITARFILVLYIHGIILYYLWYLGSTIGLGDFFYGLSVLPFILFGSKEKRWVVASCMITAISYIIFAINMQAWLVPQINFQEDTLHYIHVAYRITSYFAVLTPPLLLFVLTERYRGKIRDEQARLVEVAKMSSLGEMAAGLAHEINNPLAIIVGAAEKIRRQEGSPDREKPNAIEEAVKLIIETGQRISKIVRALLTFSRESTEDPMEMVSICEIVSDAVTICKQRFNSHGIPLQVTLPNSADATVSCRQGQIEQILVNLLCNAFDAVEGTHSPAIDLFVEANAELIVIRVVDSGSGIAPSIAARMMDPFFTTKGVGKGTGLGLSISRSIAINHGGQLIYDSGAPNTTFVLTLPRAALKNVDTRVISPNIL